MPLRDGFFSTATQTSCCNRIQRSNRVRLLVVSTHDFPDKTHTLNKYIIISNDGFAVASLLVYHYDKSYDSQRTDAIETHHTYYLL